MARPDETTAATSRVLAELERRELLLQAGREFASIANIVAGETINGSWWAHPQSNLIYWVCQDLDEHPRVDEARLLAGKVTHLWDTLWPHVAAVALAREPWQFDGLSEAARGLLERVDEGTVDTNVLHWASKTEKLGDTCRMLERRLLVKSVEIHLPSGRHAKQLSTWRSWWTLRGAGALPSAAAARERIEAAVGDAVRWLPWHARASGRASK